MIGLADYGRGDYTRAMPTLGRAVAHFRRSAHIVLLARSLINFALAQEGEGHMEEALQSYLEARLILSDTKYELDKARIELSLGTLLLNSGRTQEAEDAFLRAYSPYLRHSGLTFFQGLATNNLGNVYLAQGRLAEAEALLRESVALWCRAGGQVQLANTLGTLAETLAAQGRVDEALAGYEDALKRLATFPNDKWACHLLEKFGKARAALLEAQYEEEPDTA
jgi:tetratricopeptide (TPR) repeat protein